MARARKNWRVLNISLDSVLHDELDAYCQNTGFHKTVVVEQAIRSFLDAEAKKQEFLNMHQDELSEEEKNIRKEQSLI